MKIGYYHYLITPLKEFSEDLTFIDRSNPLKIKLNGRKFSIVTQYINPAGAKRTDPDEPRIQGRRAIIDKQLQNKKDGYEVIYLGLYQSGRVFHAYNSVSVNSFQGSSNRTVCSRFSSESESISKGIGVYGFHANNLDKFILEPVIPIESLGFYLMNTDKFHIDLSKIQPGRVSKKKQIKSEKDYLRDVGSLIEISNKVSRGQDLSKDEERLKKTVNVKKKIYPRDPQFRIDVLEAYDHKCAICGIQLGVVEAAHITPHSKPEGKDTITNGIALCVLHHKLYDKEELFFIDKDRRLKLNNEKVEVLKFQKRDLGLNDIIEECKRKYRVPKNTDLSPSDEFVELSKKYRPYPK